MNLALWKKALADAWRQLLVSGILLALFGWVFVWLQSLIKFGAWVNILNILPDFVEKIAGVPLADLASPQGRIGILYFHLVTLLLCIGWAVGRGTDTVGGGISRGTLELVVTLPVRRASILLIPAAIATLGAAILALSLWLGNWLGLVTVDFAAEVSILQFLPGAVNLFFMTFALTGVTTMLSSLDNNRWRTMWLAVAFFIVSGMLDMVAALWEPGSWLAYCSFLSAFDPQRLIILGPDGWTVSLRYNAVLLAVGLAGYLAAAVVFSRRDIPVPK
jgi:ABC-type transport system involved in multi-copper enzyme maturation permease subunit